MRMVDLNGPLGDTTGRRVYAKRPFMYNAVNLDWGQVFTMIGARNDRKLVELNYVGLIADDNDLYTCADDGIDFIDLPSRTAHGKRLEDERRGTVTPMEEDARLASQERMLAETAPVGRGVAKSGK